METLADYGTVSYFGIQTFATGIYTSWFSFADRGAAAQLAFCLLIFALVVALLEQIQRGAARNHGAGQHDKRPKQAQLRGWRAAGAFTLCAVPVFFGFLLPITLLLFMSLESEQSLFSTRYFGFIKNSLILASTAALATVFMAVLLASFKRFRPGKTSRTAANIARVGYAVPGGVIAVGLLVPFALLDNGIDTLAERYFDVSTGLIFTGSITVLIIAYMVRFMAGALNTYDGGLATLNTKLESVSRSLGTGSAGILFRVHFPVLKTSVFTALLIVFVDVMKELPATLIMRPFNFDTLAVQAHRLASDERLAGAAVPSLVIVTIGLLPVILLCRRLSRPD